MLVMRHLIAISRCKKASGPICHFGFRGFLCGEEITLLKLQSLLGVKWELGEDYVLAIEVHSVQKRILSGRILRAKKLTEVMTNG